MKTKFLVAERYFFYVSLLTQRLIYVAIFLMKSISKFWERISYNGVADVSNFLPHRRTILLNQICAISILDCFLIEVLFIGFHLFGIALLHAFCTAVYFSVLYLNRKGYHCRATLVFLVTVAIEVFFVCLLLGNSTGLFLYYFPTACAGLILFDESQRRQSFIIIGLCLLFTTLLHLPKEYYSSFRIPVEADLSETLFGFVLYTSFLITVLCVYHLLKANLIAERQMKESFYEVEKLNEELILHVDQLSLLTKGIDLEKAKLSAIMESSNHLIWSVDSDYRLIYSNSNYSHAFGHRFGRQLQVGDRILDYLPHEVSTEWKRWYDKALRGSKFSVENPGKGFYWEIFFHPIVELEHQVVGVTVFMQDITSRKKAEQEMIAAKELAEQASKAKAQFLSTMSHEIRTPMNAVIGLTNLLLLEDPKEEQKQNLNVLKFSATNLLSLINDILDFSKIESGKIEFEEVAFSIKELIENTRQTLLLKASEKQLALETELDEAIPGMVIGDPTRLNQIMTNLIGNAIKFTPTGKVTIKVIVRHIEEDSIAIDFAVQDTGIGIKEDKIHTIFDSFTQASSDTTRNFGGSGLGLAITKRLLELQNSTIHVQSSPGVGSRFYFTLSFKRSEKGLKPRDKQPSEASIQEHRQSLEGYKVLVVEDNLINQMIASKFLLRWGLQIDMADNGLIALERVKAGDYDLILMDLEMPEMDGCSATKAIRSLGADKYKCIPIIALTASAFMEVQQEVYAAGMNGYLTKPFNPNEMLKVIANCLVKQPL